MNRIPALIPQRKMEGIFAILLPFDENGAPDYAAFITHVERTYTRCSPHRMDTSHLKIRSSA